MLRLRPDLRRYEEHDDRTGHCRRCGMKLFLLPGDKRRGYCFDCFESLMTPPQPID